MSKTICLARYPSGSLFNDHWALFIPDKTHQPPTRGTLLQVEGNPVYGFVYAVVRDCDIKQDHDGRRPPILIELGVASQQHLESNVGVVQGMESLDSTCDVERLALSIRPPGKSMLSANNGEDDPPRKRIEVRDCQWWVKEVVKKLVTKEVLTQEAMDTLLQVPAH